MSFELYEKAYKLGKKAYKAKFSEGDSPYLPVLDYIINKEDISGEVNLGLVDIPLDRVVGTSTAGRTQAFAANFMPLMNPGTEFAAKWSSLSDAHLNEGIRDAIKVYEYLNYYYVVEGNKRVSVLKYFEADSIPAFVTRKIPKPSEDEIIKIYYEFMDFNKKTGINNIWFSHEGCFQRLMNAVKAAPVHGGELGDEDNTSSVVSSSDSIDGAGTIIRADVRKVWKEDTVLEYKAAYKRFEKAFKQKDGDQLENITTGDAFLTFIEIKGFDAVCDMSLEDILVNISAMWQEFLVINEQSEVEVSLDPPEGKTNVIKKILTPSYSAAKPLKVAFLYDREPGQSDWLYAHELGRNHIKEVFGDKVNVLKITTAYNEEDAVAAMEDLIENQGVEVIFTTTIQMIDASLKCAIKYPDAKILNCSLNTTHRYIRTYYARLYEAKFLSGMIAGALTDTDKIGYIADYPIFGMTASINAFALGAKMVNPRVKVYLKWSTLKENSDMEEVYKALYDEGIDYLSDQDMIIPKQASRKFGMYRLTAGGPENITMTAYNWGALYEKIIDIIMDGKWGSTDAGSESKPINYLWGLSAGVVDLIISEKVPVEIRRLANTFRELIAIDQFSPFLGRVVTQDGTEISEDGKELEIDDIIKMNYLVENVVGKIPVIEDLTDDAREIVEMKGVKN